MQMAKDTCPVIPNADFMTLRLTAKREKGLSGANPESPEGRGFRVCLKTSNGSGGL
jgi:hypothetical protein